MGTSLFDGGGLCLRGAVPEPGREDGGSVRVVRGEEGRGQERHRGRRHQGMRHQGMRRVIGGGGGASGGWTAANYQHGRCGRRPPASKIAARPTTTASPHCLPEEPEGSELGNFSICTKTRAIPGTIPLVWAGFRCRKVPRQSGLGKNSQAQWHFTARRRVRPSATPRCPIRPLKNPPEHAPNSATGVGAGAKRCVCEATSSVRRTCS